MVKKDVHMHTLEEQKAQRFREYTISLHCKEMRKKLHIILHESPLNVHK